MKVLVTGSAGFIAGYLVKDLLDQGYEVIGVDDFSKYGPVEKSYQNHPGYRFHEHDAKDPALMNELAAEADYAIGLAAKIGGIAYFHRFAYDIMAENERLSATLLDAAIASHDKGKMKRVVMVSSSMVFENATVFPTPESVLSSCPPPTSAYGFQKLACEYFARAARDQYGLPYTIVRPFNCVGTGEARALNSPEIPSGNLKLAMSHVVPDLVYKIFMGQDPLHILGSGQQVRHYTYGGDLARGIRMAMESEKAENQDFNLSTAESMTVLELAECIWKRIRPGKPFAYVSDPPFPHDVQFRSPEVGKARELLGFEAEVGMDRMLDEVVPWIEEAIQRKAI